MSTRAQDLLAKANELDRQGERQADSALCVADIRLHDNLMAQAESSYARAAGYRAEALALIMVDDLGRRETDTADAIAWRRFQDGGLFTRLWLAVTA